MLELQGTPAGPLMLVGIEEDLHLGFGENHGSYIAALHHDAGAAGDLALGGDEGSPHGRHGGYARSGERYFLRSYGGADIFAIEIDSATFETELDVGFLGELFQTMHVSQVSLALQGPEGNRAVHGAGVDVDEAEAVGNTACEGTLPGPGRAVNGNHNAFVTQ